MLSASGLVQTVPKSRSDPESRVQPTTAIPTEPDVTLTEWLSTGASPGDEAPDLLLVQRRYEEHLARHALQELFETGQLESLCG